IPPRVSPYPVDTVKDPDVLKSDVLREATAECGGAPCRFSCDQWNYFLKQATALPVPNVDTGCLTGGDRPAQASFEHWYDRLQGARSAVQVAARRGMRFGRRWFRRKRNRAIDWL